MEIILSFWLLFLMVCPPLFGFGRGPIAPLGPAMVPLDRKDLYKKKSWDVNLKCLIVLVTNVRWKGTRLLWSCKACDLFPLRLKEIQTSTRNRHTQRDAPFPQPPPPDNRWRQLSFVNPDSRQPTETRQVHWGISFAYVWSRGKRWGRQ